MRALHTTMVEEGRVVGITSSRVESSEKGAPSTLTMLRNMALFLAAPFVGLVYAVLLPFVGLGMLVWVVARPLVTKEAVASAIGIVEMTAKLVGAALLALACLITFPFAALAALAWTAGRGTMHPVRA